MSLKTGTDITLRMNFQLYVLVYEEIFEKVTFSYSQINALFSLFTFH